MSLPQKPKIILCTGSSGSGRHAFVEEMANECVPKEKKNEVGVFRVFDYMKLIGRERGISITEERILYMEEHMRRVIRGSALDRILREIQAHKYKYGIISTPATFRWRGREMIRGLEYADIMKLNPDLFITIIDDVIRTKDTLSKEKQWKDHKFSLRDISEWRESEIDDTKQFTTFFDPNRDYYIVAREHPPQVLYDLIFSPQKKKAYFSFPITHMSEKQIQEARKVCNNLRDFYVIFDPLTIRDHLVVDEWKKRKKEKKPMPYDITFEVEYRYGREAKKFPFTCPTKEIEDASEHLDAQIVRRDIALIDQSDVVIVWYPTIKLSTGVIFEIAYGYFHNKKVYMFHPYEPSPFLDYMCDRIFPSKKRFIKFLQEEA